MKNASTLLRLATLTAAAAASIIITGCAAPGGDAFSKAPVYSPTDSFRGAESRVVTIRSMRAVMLKKNSAGTWQSIAAPGAAAAVGGILGNQVGERNSATSRIGAIFGAAAGAFAGNALFEAKSEVPAIEFSVSYIPETAPGVKPKLLTLSVVQEADSTVREIAPGWTPGAKLVPLQARMVRTAQGERIVPL